MILEIYGILPIEWEGQFLLNLDHPVALVEFDFEQTRGRLKIVDASYQDKLTRLFSEPCGAFHSATSDEGNVGDSYSEFPAWTREAAQVIVRDKLLELGLGARPRDWASRPD